MEPNPSMCYCQTVKTQNSLKKQNTNRPKLCLRLGALFPSALLPPFLVSLIPATLQLRSKFEALRTKVMDDELPVAKRTRLRKAEQLYNKLHGEIRSARNGGNNSNAATVSTSRVNNGVQGENFGGSFEKCSKTRSLDNTEKIKKSLVDSGSVGVRDEKGKDCEKNCGVNPVTLDDSEDDVVFLGEVDEGDLKEEKEVVLIDNVDDNDDGVGSDDGSQSGVIEGVDFGGLKGEKEAGNGSSRDFNRDIDVGQSTRGLQSDIERSGRSRVLRPRRKTSENSNQAVLVGERNGNVEIFSGGIENEDDALGLNGMKSNEVAGRTELPSSSCGKNKDGYGGDDFCYVFEDVEESDSSSSGEEKEVEEDSEEEIEEVNEDAGDGEYDVSEVEELSDGKEEKGQVEEKEHADTDNKKQAEVGFKRIKVCGLEILCDPNNSNECIDSCVAKRTRSHYDSESSKKIMKLGTFSRPLCVDEEQLDGNSDDEYNDESYEAGDVVRRTRTSKPKGRSGGVNGGDVNDGEKTCRAGQTTRSSKRINGPRKGSREKNVQDSCGVNPVKRKRIRAVTEPEVIRILANSILDQAEVPIEEKNEPLKDPSLPLKFTSEIEESTPPEKSEEEKELEGLWSDMALALCSKDATDNSMQDENEDDAVSEIELDTATLCRQGNHRLILDEEIGLICKYCSFVHLEIRYWVPPFDTNPWAKSERRYSVPMQHDVFNKLHDQVSGHDLHPGQDCFAHTRGTVWDLIPGIEKGMHGHQRDGFEFIWKSIAGSIYLDKLKEHASVEGGTGCIISHAPGTGKTRLAIAFLQTYMELYPTCRPVIVAPCSMLLTWEAEFLKWGVDIPFHNMNNPDVSGKESETAMNVLREAKSVRHSSNSIRMVKLYSWKQEKSILGISYQLFEELVNEEKRKSKARNKAEDDTLKKVLLKLPGLLVLDEGHTPRNEKSLIWKALSKVQTQRRIILSGTPFQNNFDELYNTLCLVKPKFAAELSPKHCGAFLNRRGHKRSGAKGKWASLTSVIGKVNDDKLEARMLEELRKIIRCLAHVHRGDILQERLPGLRDSVVILQPVHLQKTILDDAKKIKGLTYFDMENLVSLVSVHPSLLLKKSFGAQEFVDRKNLERLRLNPDAGVKTRFLMELIRLCQARNEKVLVFSQYLDPLFFVMEQLASKFSWVRGKDVLYMCGQVDPDARQSLIKQFNNANSEVKVMLASTRACSEGINLVGASRVVLLDVVWNPAVETQAINRAYRLGQENVVYVYHLIASGTMEEEKYWRQVKKERLSELVFYSSDGSCNHQNGAFDISGDKRDKVLEELVERKRHKIKKIIYQPKDTNLVKSFGLDF